MTPKNILMVCPGHIYPLEMGSQVRMYHLARRLARDHRVDVVARVPHRSHLSGPYSRELGKICREYYPLLAPNRKSFFHRIYYKIKHDFFESPPAPDVLFYHSIPPVQEKILQIAENGRYDIILCEYWYSCLFYEALTYRPYLAVDTIDVNFEKYGLLLETRGGGKQKAEKLGRYRELELAYTGRNHLVISVSEADYRFFKKQFPRKDHLKIPIGQDLAPYLEYPSNGSDGKKILFYGNLESRQNRRAFARLTEAVLPKIRQRVPGVELLVVGANPPPEIMKFHDGKRIQIPGYAADVREWISKAAVLVLPLELGGGFRTRVVEVLALGIPVVGTPNALDCIEMEDGVQGTITDSDEEMAAAVIRLLRDGDLRKKMSRACRAFVSEHYSVEKTYGKLSGYFLEL